jgi:PAS domain S-box-containing protein
MSEIDTGQYLVSLDKLRHLKKVVEGVTTGLTNQQKILQMRGLDLPPDAVQSLSVVQTNLIQLERNINSDETEISQLHALVENSAMINSSLQLDGVLSSAMDEIINLTGAERGFILLRNEDTDELEFRVSRTLNQDVQAAAGDELEISNTILNEVMTSGEPLLSDNAYKDPRMQSSETISRYVLRSVMCVPLHNRGRTIGVIYVDNRLRTAVFTERELNLLMAFAHQVAAAIENARLFTRQRANLIEVTEVKELMENVFASIASGVITTSAADQILMYNNAAADILATASDYALNQPLHTLMPDTDIDLDEFLSAVRQNNESYAVESHPDIPGRGRVVLNIKFSPLKDAEHNTQGVAMVLDDITQEREREEMITHVKRYLPPGMMEKIHHIAQLALGGERREMTCMFAEVCPMSKFSETMRPAQMMETLNRYLEVATESIHHANGLIDKYMGSELMVLFNTQLNPQHNHVLKAVEAALDLRDALLSDPRLPQIEPYYRIGIHTGEATLGNVGSRKRRNFTAIGDTINLSKRLQENAVNGQIILSQDALAYIEAGGGLPAHIRLEERDAIQAKGRQQSTAIYEVFRA